MANQRNLKWFGKLGLIIVIILGSPQVIRAVLQSTLYLPIVYKALPTSTPTPTATPTLTPTPTATKAPSPIINPSFEQGTTGWFFIEAYLTSSWAYNGKYSAVLGNGDHSRTASIFQRFTVPYNQYNLQYWQFTESNEICSSGIFDKIVIYVDGHTKYTNKICDDLNGFDNWILNLVDYRGDTIDFKMEFISDGSIKSIVYVDDFTFVP